MEVEVIPHEPERAPRAAEILSYWFATLDDASALDPGSEPFATCYRRWYGKDATVDAEIRERFEPELRHATGGARSWPDEIARWSRAPDGLLALVVLLDQLPRNMYRGTAAMYAHDPLALSVATLGIAAAARESGRARQRPSTSLVRRMFLHVPLLHVESPTIQRLAVASFGELVGLARESSPRNVAFFEHALGSARRHAAVIQRFGRFPHRNAILGRTSTPEEEEYLRGPDPGF